MNTTTTTTGAEQAAEINNLIAPWLPASIERMPWTVTLDGGTEITICCPLGAAVEVELAGHHIRAQA